MTDAAYTIPGAVEHAAARWPDAIALEERPAGDPDGALLSLSFSQLWERCLDAARAFIAAGLEPGDRVAIWAPNRHEWILAAVGLHCVGGVLVPINTRFKPRETAYVLARSRARLLVSVGRFLGTDHLAALHAELGLATGDAPGVLAGLPELRRVIALPSVASATQRAATPAAASPDAAAPAWCTAFDAFLRAGQGVPRDAALARLRELKAEDVSDMLFTSGTTGHPKGVMTQHAQNLRAFSSWSDVVGLKAGDRYLIVNPFFHSFGYKAGWLACFIRGATILPHPVFEPAQVLARIAADRVTVLPGPPTLYQAILAQPDFASYDVSSLRLAVTGAASIPVELIHRMKDVLGLETVITGYGLTETCGVVAMCRFDDDVDTIATTSGRAIDGVEMRTVDRAGAAVSPGEPGEIVVRGYNVMQGYFEDEAATREAIDSAGWLHTGDIGVIDARGYVRVTDRQKDMFIMGGFNCYPAEIENQILAHPDVHQVAVIGVPDQRMGEVGMAFVVPRPGAALDGAALSTWCRAQLANYKVPRHIQLVAALPINATGKVMKYLLREQASQRLAAEP